MSDVEVPFDDKTSDNAVLLLAAAEELGLGAGVVRTTEGAFVVPEKVYDKAFGEPEPEPEPEPEKKAPAKKATKKK